MVLRSQDRAGQRNRPDVRPAAHTASPLLDVDVFGFLVSEAPGRHQLSPQYRRVRELAAAADVTQIGTDVTVMRIDSRLGMASGSGRRGDRFTISDRDRSRSSRRIPDLA